MNWAEEGVRNPGSFFTGLAPLGWGLLCIAQHGPWGRGSGSGWKKPSPLPHPWHIGLPEKAKLGMG